MREEDRAMLNHMILFRSWTVARNAGRNIVRSVPVEHSMEERTAFLRRLRKTSGWSPEVPPPVGAAA